MSGPEQVLFLVVVPAAIVAVIWALASIGGPQATKRYRPGRPYEFVPVWYLANHRHPANPTGRPELTAGTAEPDRGGQLQGSTGGASDRW
ncbi:MAG: hypothetical protein GEV12_14735 [Micromonosporaceae bacterium]|nr:hypothetical protein [Micromonosporaceae bacterium]